MSQTRDLKTDLFAIALCGAVVFLSLSLCTYDPADPVGELIRPFNHWYQSDVLVYPLADEVSNACGRWGALAADILFTSLGFAAFYFVLSLAILDVLLLRRRKVDAPIIRSLGWFASAVGLTTVMTILIADVSPGPMIGAGGYLGALGKAILLEYFATAGGLILAVSLICAGLLLATDYAVVGIARRTTLVFLASSLRLVRWLVARKPATLAQEDELEEEYEEDELWEEEEEEEEELEEEMPILVSGKKLGSDGEAEQEELSAEESESEDLVQEEAESSRKRSKKSRRAARKPHFTVLRKQKNAERQEVI
ncbi:MAG: DNA translocase FtsK 4TM domain-containing protein, partial [Pirellulaceae bacterium]